MKIVKDRLNLANEIPIVRPWAPMIEMSTGCNFSCKFCPTSNKEEMKRGGFVRKHMKEDLFKKIIDQLCDFPDTGQPFKLYYNGFGESMVHPQFVELVQYATEKTKGIVKSHIIRTNGSMLTPETNRKLIEAGMTEINISIEAVNEKGYYEITGRKGMFQKLVDNVTDLYNNRGKCRIYTKIIPLGTPETDKDEFFRIFGPISNMIDVEYPMHWSGVQYDTTLGIKKPEITVNGDPITPNVTCPYIFYTMMINVHGIVHLCCFDPWTNVNVGDVNINTLQEIWTGKKIKEFWKMHLLGKRYNHPSCGNCEYIYGAPDFLTEEEREEILKRL